MTCVLDVSRRLANVIRGHGYLTQLKIFLVLLNGINSTFFWLPCSPTIADESNWRFGCIVTCRHMGNLPSETKNHMGGLMTENVTFFSMTRLYDMFKPRLKQGHLWKCSVVSLLMYPTVQLDHEWSTRDWNSNQTASDVIEDALG